MFTGGAEPVLTASRHHRQVQGEQQTNRLVRHNPTSLARVRIRARVSVRVRVRDRGRGRVRVIVGGP